MTDINEHSIKRIVVGYTLDSVIEAHNQAQNVENNVVFYSTGTLGEPLDKYNDFISYDDAKRLSVILPDLEFDEFPGCDFLYIPYEKLKFKNSHNGLITLPFNKLSFDDVEEWKAVRDGYLDEHVQAIFKDMSNSPTRLITMFKQYLKNPRGFAFWRKVCMTYPESSKRLWIDCMHYVANCIIAHEPRFIYESPRKLRTVLMLPFGAMLMFYIKWKAKRS